MTLSGKERLLMGAAMFDAARDMVVASLPEDLPPMNTSAGCSRVSTDSRSNNR